MAMCIHGKKIVEEINKLIKEVKDKDSLLWAKLGPYLEYKGGHWKIYRTFDQSF